MAQMVALSEAITENGNETSYGFASTGAPTAQPQKAYRMPFDTENPDAAWGQRC